MHGQETILYWSNEDQAFIAGVPESPECIAVGDRIGSPQRKRRLAVYSWCMSRTNINVDDKACAEIMRRYGLSTKREAVNFALRTLAAEPAPVKQARAMRGSGWEGNLKTMRSGRHP